MKKSKKFVLAGLVLLAITMVLLPLAGCKNDTVPPEVEKQEQGDGGGSETDKNDTVPEPTRYTVKFDKNAEDASGEMQSQIFTEGVEQELSANEFKRDTYTFNGWSEDKAATAPTYKDKAKFKATKDTTLYAVWTDNGTVSPVTFSLPDGTKFYFGESIAVSLETTTEGATIQYKRDDGEWMDYTEETPISVTTSTTITARATKDGLKPNTETTATYTVRKLEGITVTTLPAQTVYSVGQSFDPTGMVVTATYDDGEERTVTGTITTDTSTLTESAGVQTVTVRYSEGGIEVSGQFEIRVLPKKLTDYESPNNTDDSWTYVAFGEWPQTEAVDFNPTTTPKSHGIFVDTYYVEGNDKYVKAGGKYYKVEPIVWRVLNKDYKTTGTALLLAEKILTGGIKWADSSNNYKESYIRQWLNGNSGTGETSDYNGDAGFLQTAFTESAQNLIADTTVDNSAASTTDAGNNLTQADGCSDTTDKIFLLSEEEATTSEYGFAEYNVYVGDGTTLTSTRIRVTTDYAKATGAYQEDSSGGCWWLRSPYYDFESLARGIYINGDADYRNSVYDATGGVVPALSISLQ